MDVSFFQQPGVIFGIAAALTWIAKRFRLPYTLFLLMAGALLGTNGLGWWSSFGSFQLFADIGIAMLLFLVGMGMSPAFFQEVGWRPVRLVGQSVLAIGLAGVFWTGVFPIPVFLRVVIGVLFAFNSTMLSLKALGERHELEQTHGKLVTSILVLQDVMAGFVLLAVSLWQVSAQQGSAAGMFLFVYLIKLVLLGGICWLAARIWTAKIWRALAKQPDAFLLAAFAYPLFVGAMFTWGGISAELGALVAGISLASSDFRYELMGRLRPLRDIFLAPFFFLIGLQWSWIEARVVLPHIVLGWMIVGVFAPVFMAWRAKRAGYLQSVSMFVGGSLAHMSEFALLVMALLGSAVPTELRMAVISIVMISMVTGTLLVQAIPWIVRRVRRYWPEKREVMELKTIPEAFLFGCHRVGSDFLSVIKKQHRPFVVVDVDPQVIEDMRQRRIQAIFGDLENRELLEQLSIEKAKLIVSTVPDLSLQIHLLRYLKRKRAKSIVILVAHEVQDALELYRMGASYVILPHFLGGNYASQLVTHHGYNADLFEVERAKHLKHLKQRG